RHGLDVPGVEMAGPSAQKNENARTGRGFFSQWAIAIDPRRNHAWHAERQGADASRLQQLAARNSERGTLGSAHHVLPVQPFWHNNSRHIRTLIEARMLHK